MVFFHKASRTLILADFIENFEPRMMDDAIHALGDAPRWRARSARRDAAGRAGYVRYAMLSAAVRTMRSWDPERIILAHGSWYEKDGAGELERPFRKLLAG